MPRFERMRYVGAPFYLPEIPKRDIDGEEWYALDAEVRERAMALKLYEGVSAPVEKPSRRRGHTDNAPDEAESVVFEPISTEVVADAPAEGEG